MLGSYERVSAVSPLACLVCEKIIIVLQSKSTFSLESNRSFDTEILWVTTSRRIVRAVLIEDTPLR